MPEGGFNKKLSLEETIEASAKIVIVKWVKNGPKTPENFPNTSIYDWIEVKVTDSLKGSYRIGDKFNLNTSDVCGYNQNYNEFSGADNYLLFLNENNGPVFVRKNNEYYDGLKQYKIVGNNIEGLNITVQELKNKIPGYKNIKIYSVKEFQDLCCEDCDCFLSPIEPVIFKVEGYVIKDEVVPFNCPRNPDGTMPMCSRPVYHRFLIINDSPDDQGGLKLLYGRFEKGEFKIGEKYVFDVKVGLSFDSYTISNVSPPNDNPNNFWETILNLINNFWHWLFR
jgi:hypothetical protein